MVERFAIKIAYLGQNFRGFQRQKTGIKTVEGAIADTLKKLGILDTLAKARYSAAGRTDAGVHALGQVIAFDTTRTVIHLGELNQFLPDDIFAWAIAKVGSNFNARHSAKRRTYKYFLPYTGERIDLMEKSLTNFEGTHDFEKYCKKPDMLSSGNPRSTIQTIDKASMELLPKEELLQFTFTSQSFLWNQVRKMVSMIQDVGREVHSLEILKQSLQPALNIPKGGIRPASPDGLVLYEVYYPDIKFIPIKNKNIIEDELLKKTASLKSLLAVLNIFHEKIL